jgi:methylation protein EvaC
MRYYLGAIGEHQIDPSVANLLEKERGLGVHLTETYHRLAKKIQRSKDELVNLLEGLRAQGKTISGYGATSKSTTILNYCKIGPDLLSYISDTTPIKIGKYAPGSHIPVVSREHFTKHPTDYVFLFAWNHALEIKDKEAWFSSQGGNWISHVPDVSILKKF